MKGDIVIIKRTRTCDTCHQLIEDGEEAQQLKRTAKKTGRVYTYAYRHVGKCPSPSMGSPLRAIGKTEYKPGGGRILRHPTSFS